MSIMSKYVVSTMLVHHQHSYGDQRGKQHEAVEDLSQSSKGLGWQRWLFVTYPFFLLTVRYFLKN